MCYDKRKECVKTTETNKSLDNNEQIVCNLLPPSFYNIFVVLYGDVLNPIFRITLMIFVKGLPKDSCDGL